MRVNSVELFRSCILGPYHNPTNFRGPMEIHKTITLNKLLISTKIMPRFTIASQIVSDEEMEQRRTNTLDLIRILSVSFLVGNSQ